MASLRKTTDQFIAEAQKVHGDKYDYSKTEYVLWSEKVCIICPKHGVFFQTPNSHLNGNGCPLCGMVSARDKLKFTTQDFILKAKERHGDRYDYSLAEYTTAKGKVKIICHVHGVFEQQAYNHLKGSGCPKCKNKNVTTKDFIEKARAVHGEEFDYSEVDYVKSKKKVRIICKKHGVFLMTPENHLQGQKCPKCAIDNNANRSRLTKEIFIEKANMMHNYKYDYSKVIYKNYLTPVEIICPKHGSFFQMPSNHLKGEECLLCGISKRTDNETYSTDDFLKLAKVIHGNTYDYSEVKYEKTNKKVRIICKLHGAFLQTPANHLKGKGCPHCNMSHGEIKVKNILDKMKICYKQQYRFPNENLFCKNKKLVVDFFIPSLNTVIEYNGEQHYIEMPIWGGEATLKQNVERDEALRMYCNDHKINLIEIPYTEKDNIEYILKRKLKLKRL